MTKRECEELAVAWDWVSAHSMQGIPGSPIRIWAEVANHARAEAQKARDLAATLTEVEATDDCR